MTSNTSGGGPEGSGHQQPARDAQGWQRPGQGPPFSQEGYFPGQAWQRGSGMAGSGTRGQGHRADGGRVSAGGISVPDTTARPSGQNRGGGPQQDHPGGPDPSRPILRVTWPGSSSTSPGSSGSRGGGAPPGPPMTPSQRLYEGLRTWYWDRWYALEDAAVELIQAIAQKGRRS